jgi:hypothetical protein
MVYTFSCFMDLFFKHMNYLLCRNLVASYLQLGKTVGAGLATCGLTGAGVGVGIVFGSLLLRIRNYSTSNSIEYPFPNLLEMETLTAEGHDSQLGYLQHFMYFVKDEDEYADIKLDQGFQYTQTKKSYKVANEIFEKFGEIDDVIFHDYMYDQMQRVLPKSLAEHKIVFNNNQVLSDRIVKYIESTNLVLGPSYMLVYCFYKHIQRHGNKIS